MQTTNLTYGQAIDLCVKYPGAEASHPDCPNYVPYRIQSGILVTKYGTPPTFVSAHMESRWSVKLPVPAPVKNLTFGAALDLLLRVRATTATMARPDWDTGLCLRWSPGLEVRYSTRDKFERYSCSAPSEITANDWIVTYTEPSPK